MRGQKEITAMTENLATAEAVAEEAPIQIIQETPFDNVTKLTRLNKTQYKHVINTDKFLIPSGGVS